MIDAQTLLTLMAWAGGSAKVTTDLVRIILAKSGKSNWNDVVLPFCAILGAIGATFLSAMAYLDPSTVWSTQLIAMLVLQGAAAGASAIGITELAKVGRNEVSNLTLTTTGPTILRPTTDSGIRLLSTEE